MPRPTTPANLSATLQIRPVQLNIEQKSEIEGILGIHSDIRLDRAEKDTVIDGVEEALTGYQFFVAATEPTPAAKIKCFEKLKHGADELLTSLSSLDHTRHVLERICVDISTELERLRETNKMGRKTNSTLRNTIALLNLLFAQHCRYPTEQKRLEFLSAALAAANIPLPKNVATIGKTLKTS